MKNCHVVIVGNGNITENFLKRVNSADFVISVDRATLYLIDRGVIPDIAIGDFDSVSLSELEIIKKKAKKTIIYKDKKYNYLSLISYTDHAVVSISGCRYNISKKTLLKGSSLGVSNEIIDGAAQIDVHRGILIMIQSRD